MNVLFVLVEIRDEFHFILVYPLYNDLKEMYIKPYYWKKPSIFKLKIFIIQNHRSETKLYLMYTVHFHCICVYILFCTLFFRAGVSLNIHSFIHSFSTSVHVMIYLTKLSLFYSWPHASYIAWYRSKCRRCRLHQRQHHHRKYQNPSDS